MTLSKETRNTLESRVIQKFKIPIHMILVSANH